MSSYVRGLIVDANFIDRKSVLHIDKGTHLQRARWLKEIWTKDPVLLRSMDRQAPRYVMSRSYHSQYPIEDDHLPPTKPCGLFEIDEMAKTCTIELPSGQTEFPLNHCRTLYRGQETVGRERSTGRRLMDHLLVAERGPFRVMSVSDHQDYQCTIYGCKI